MFETPPKKGEAKKEAVDQNWYERFEKIGSFQAYEYLDGDKEYRKRERSLFLSGEKENPTLDYPELDLGKIDSVDANLEILKKDILEQEDNSVVRQVYRWRINEKIAEIRMLRASANGDMKRFERYSEFIYGRPSPEIFSYTVRGIRTIAKAWVGSENTAASAAASDILSSLPEAEALGSDIAPPDLKTVLRGKNQTESDLGEIFNIQRESNETLDASAIKDAFTLALEQIKAEGWVAEISTSSKTGISVNHEKKAVVIPESKTLTVKRLRELITHEIGTHTLRRINGERSRLRLLGLGLDRYEAAEEGIATVREQSLREKASDFSGLDGYLSVSLAKGLDGTPRDFRGVFMILKKYFLLLNISNGLDLEAAQEKADESAWNRCVRTFRGTDCKTKGICFTKDIIYREGNIAVWDIISKNQPEMTRFNIGKYDPSNMRHLWILEQLNITEKDLTELQEENNGLLEKR